MRMMTALQTRRSAATIVLALGLAACGAAGDGDTDDDPAAVETPQDPSDEPSEVDEEEEPEPSAEESEPEPEPEPEPPPVVVASPLDIPLPINVLSGSVYADRLGEIEDLVREACGGELCLTIVKKGQGSTLFEGDVCDRIDTVEGTVFDDAGQGHLTVDPGGEFVVLVNVRCEDVPASPGVDGSITTSAP
ncbi:hypothetical protein [Ornithinimicrobium cerasi]|uniref:hypothetical protein n=1 Tax=Ornithinimicrobium cerasi TaxID=2248773 RepID=UPI000EFE65EB|nr:hypothetical protein [Ornithinimicrobium cerasi]